MINSVDLVSNSEERLSLDDLRGLKLTNVWLELKEPTNEELVAVSEKTEIPVDLLELKEVSQSVNLSGNKTLESSILSLSQR